MSNTINLDAARAARRETKKTEPKVVFHDKTFTLPIEMPFAVVEHLGKLNPEDPGASSGVILEFVKELFGDQFDDFRRLQPSANDIEALMDALNDVYGLSVGESGASGDSSKKSTRP